MSIRTIFPASVMLGLTAFVVAFTNQVATSTVTAVAETRPVPHAGDAADDPAIWVDRHSPARSVVVGTDKEGGIAVYDLTGRQIQYRPDGDLNNVDLRAGFPLNGARIVLVAASNRSDDTIRLYRLDTASRRLIDVTARRTPVLDGIYGLCMYRAGDGRYFAFVTQSDSGVVAQVRLLPTRAGRVDFRTVRTFDVGAGVEGCVADDRLGYVYAAEETRALWRYRIGSARRTLVDRAGTGRLTPDIEGVALARGAGSSGYLVVSSQGDDTFAVYERGDNRYIGSFRVTDGVAHDGVTETDGIEVAATNVGSSFPRGLFVAQDDDNGDQNQNYKLVHWDEILRAVGRAD